MTLFPPQHFSSLLILIFFLFPNKCLPPPPPRRGISQKSLGPPPRRGATSAREARGISYYDKNQMKIPRGVFRIGRGDLSWMGGGGKKNKGNGHRGQGAGKYGVQDFRRLGTWDVRKGGEEHTSKLQSRGISSNTVFR